MLSIQQKVESARAFFLSGQTRDVPFRLAALRRLQTSIQAHEKAIVEALKKDLNKSPYEANMTEISLVKGELSHAISHAPRWAKGKRVRPSLGQMPASARILPGPYGVTLIMSPWNYPFMLTLSPLIGAIAAGNTVIVKPSDYARETSHVISRILTQAFEEGHVHVVEGGRSENSALLEEKYDYIFFTGSPGVGQLVMEKAARNLTPLTLELGGKSPVIVEKSADIALTARRVLFGKLVNLGQTCIAPDYVLVPREHKQALLTALQQQAAQMVPSPEYAQTMGRIVNRKHFDRLLHLLDNQTLFFGGQSDPDRLQIALTVVDDPAPHSPIMQEEIFGPLLPVLSYDTLEEALQFVESRPHPLALYLFSQDKQKQREILHRLSFGGSCINDTLMHIANHRLPFGGVGNSGMGRYHGKHTFETFSHMKAVLNKSRFLDLSVRYHPYKNSEGKLPDQLFK